MTFRAGQKVICVREIEIETPTGTIYPGPVPQLDAIYTVTGFGDTYMDATDGDVSNPDCGITIAELRGIRARKTSTSEWYELAWPIAIFSPVDERETDISTFTKMLKPKRVDA